MNAIRNSYMRFPSVFAYMFIDNLLKMQTFNAENPEHEWMYGA